MGDKSRGSLISCSSAQELASPIQSWMGSLAKMLRLLATAVLPLRDRQRSASGCRLNRSTQLVAMIGRSTAMDKKGTAPPFCEFSGVTRPCPGAPLGGRGPIETSAARPVS
jgi:hypothetical protein